MTSGVTAVIPCHTPRLVDGSLHRAVASVLDQTLPVDAITIALDASGDGAAATRQRALDMVDTQWVAFLDADDHWHPNHVATLHELAMTSGADYTYSWFSGNQPFPAATHRGRAMNPDQSHHTTMTVMVRTTLAQQVGFANHPHATPAESAEDWWFLLRCIQAGAQFAGTPEVTWHYTADGGNTSGLPQRWRATRPQTGVTVVTPHIPPRRDELLRAVDSLAAQSMLPAAWSIATDNDRAGSATTRNRALFAATTPYVAFLDDDDQLGPNHLMELIGAAETTRADVVYTGCTVVDPTGRVVPDREEWGRFGNPFDPDLLRDHSYIPVTSLVRTSLAQQVGGFRRPDGSPYDDWGFYLALLDAGATFHHHPVRTWTWHHHSNNTSGNPNRW